MPLFNELESCTDPDAYEPDLVEVEKHLRKRKYNGQRENLIKDIPRSKVLHTIDESEQVCERCGGTMVKVGEEFVRTEVQFIPASLRVIDHYRETYECRACRKNGTPYMEKSPVPHSPVMHSPASASTIAWLIHQKLEPGIPLSLYRQEKEWEALGFSLSRATMSNWLLAVYRDWLSHVVSHLKQELLKQGNLHIDEPHVQVLKEPGRKNTSDAYSGYNGVKGVTRCLCYTHLRRAFADTLPKDLHRTEASKPAEAVVRLKNPEYLDDCRPWAPMVQERCR